jgi:hypothetical protein
MVDFQQKLGKASGFILTKLVLKLCQFMKHTVLPATEPSPSPLRVPQLYELVAERLKKSILDGSYPPGSRLPAERDLATTLGVGRATVREAMGELVNQGRPARHRAADCPVCRRRGPARRGD